ncbi:hypothetical protein BH24ACT12_BH24ACT12_02320 [soil metagenome]
MLGRVEGGRGVHSPGLRRFDGYAVVLVFGCAGRYQDPAHDLLLEPGDLVQVLPGHPHWYGVTQGTWNEAYLAFDGPVFDLCARAGLVDVRRPVRRLRPLEYWLDRIDMFRTRRPPTTTTGADAEVCDVLRLLIDIVAQNAEVARATEKSRRGGGWLAESRALLATDLAEPMPLPDIAQAVGMSYESWRKRFAAETGVAPARFRTLRRINAAGDLLQRTTLTNREIAASLGFSDEHHLAKQFRRTTGTTTREFRRGTG